MKPGYNGCRAALLCHACWKVNAGWRIKAMASSAPITPPPDVCSSCEEAEMAKRFAESAQKGST